MPDIRGLTVCVGQWYAEIAKITLVRNARHFTDYYVVTAPNDPVINVAKAIPNVTVSVTDAFTRCGALFNKGLAIEEAGFDAMGREGWICIHDADVIFPESLPTDICIPSRLYGCHRRICRDPGEWTPDAPWSQWPRARDNAPIGFFQLFHASAVAHKRPWYDVSFAHAGGGDAAFMQHWSRNDWIVLPFDVLHLGPIDLNWFGCSPEGRDMMARFVAQNGWRRGMANFTPDAIERAPEPIERVQVPGYEPSRFELPFVRRARKPS